LVLDQSLNSKRLVKIAYLNALGRFDPIAQIKFGLRPNFGLKNPR